MSRLEIPKNINAQELIKKATKFGHCFIDEETQAEIFNAEKKISKAQGDVSKADGEVTSAEGKQRDAEAQSNEAQSKQNESQSKSQAAPTKESVSAQGAEAQSIMADSQARNQSMTAAISAAEQENSVFSNSFNSRMEAVDGFSIEIDSLTSENEALIAENQALMEELNQESTFDGTGSGSSSAYSLSTGTEIQEQQEAQEAQGQTQDNSKQSKIDSNNAKISSNSARAQEVTQQAQVEQQTAESEQSASETKLQEQQASAESAQAENENSNSKLQTIERYAQTASNIGGTLDAVGDVVKVAGTAVATAGGILTATGTTVGVTGGTLTATGAVITAVGAPLCALFGIGVPIVGAGGATTGSGVGVTATGATVGGTGATLLSTGTSVKKVGEGLSIAGNAIKAVGDGTTAYAKAAQGDVAGAMQATMGAISSITSCVGSIGGSSEKVANAVNKVVNGAAALQSGVSAYQSAQNGDKVGAVTNGLSAASYLTASVLGGKSIKIAERVSEGAGAISTGIATYKSIEEGDTEGAILNGLSTLGHVYGTAGNNYTVAVSNFSSALSEYSQASKDFENGDELNGHLNRTRAVLHAISGVGNAGVERTQSRADKIIEHNNNQLAESETNTQNVSSSNPADRADDSQGNAPIRKPTGGADDSQGNAPTKKPTDGADDSQGNAPTKKPTDGAVDSQGNASTKKPTGGADDSQSNTPVRTRGEEVVTLLDPKGKMFSPEFRDGLGEIVEQSATALKTNSATGDDAITGIDQYGSGVTSYGVYSQHAKVKQMGLQDDVSIVQDAQNFATSAYRGTFTKTGDVADNSYNGWTEISSVEGLTNRDGKLVSDGFHAKAFEKDGKIIVAFRGSDEASDLPSDRQLLSGKKPEQLDNAIDFVSSIRQQNPDAQIIVTGHSLGGALTELTASHFDDVLGISFNAVGTKRIVDSSEDLQDNGNTINYITQGDEISNASRHVGNTVVMDSKSDKRVTEHAVQQFGDNAFDGVEAGMVEYNTGSAAARSRSFATLDYAIRVSDEPDNTVTFTVKQFKDIKREFQYDVNTYGADLDALRAQVSHISDEGQRAELIRVIEAREEQIKGADLTGLQRRVAGESTTASSPAHIEESMSSDEVNYLAYQYGIRQSAFGDTPSAKVVFDKETTMVRVFNDETSFAKGSWLMAYDDIKGLTPEQIKEKFALPALPKYVAEITVPAGAEFVTGSCKPVKGVVSYDYAEHGNVQVLDWGNGGGTQYFFVGGNKPTEYKNMRRLPGV